MHKPHSIYSQISRAELADWREAFHQRTTPMALALMVDDLGRRLGDHAVDTPEAVFWRTAHTASRFALHRKATTVSLLETTEARQGLVAPDFEIEIDERKLRYEATEALHPARRRGDEYREDREKGACVREELVAEPHELADILQRLAERKARKAMKYDDAQGLVIVLNVWAMMTEAMHRDVWRRGTQAAASAFPEVWILDGGASHLIWQSGESVLADRHDDLVPVRRGRGA